MSKRIVELELEHFEHSKMLSGLHEDWANRELNEKDAEFAKSIFLPEIEACDFSNTTYAELKRVYPHFELLNEEGEQEFFNQLWTESDEDELRGRW